jgi:hypothetical protein
MSVDHNAETEWIEGTEKETAIAKATQDMTDLQAGFLKNYYGDVFKISADDMRKYKEIVNAYLATVPKERQDRPLAYMAEQIQATPAPEEEVAA